ncbi:Protein of unknown function [Gryllus bimaculatus]|nr:Protein of unknown function [Gryllus bimaculatus]
MKQVNIAKLEVFVIQKRLLSMFIDPYLVKYCDSFGVDIRSLILYYLDLKSSLCNLWKIVYTIFHRLFVYSEIYMQAKSIKSNQFLQFSFQDIFFIVACYFSGLLLISNSIVPLLHSLKVLLKLIYVTMSVLGIPILSFVVCFHHPCNTGTFFLIIFCLESADRLESTWDKED